MPQTTTTPTTFDRVFVKGLKGTFKRVNYDVMGRLRANSRYADLLEEGQLVSWNWRTRSKIGESVLVDESRSTGANSLTDSRNSPTLRMKMVGEASIRAPPQNWHPLRFANRSVSCRRKYDGLKLRLGQNLR
jgi:hypothetical protein